MCRAWKSENVEMSNMSITRLIIKPGNRRWVNKCTVDANERRS
jgi:hypothetical protein